MRPRDLSAVRGRSWFPGRTARAGGLMGSVLLLTACATGQPPRPAIVTLPVTFEVAPTDVPATRLAQWWTLFEDAQLTALTERALAQGFSVREALVRLEEAHALRSVALAKFGLQGSLQANAEYRDTRTLDETNSIASGFGASGGAGINKTASASLPVSWEIDLFGRRGATQRGAQADIDQARFEVEAARAAIAAEVARALFLARGLNAQGDEARETVRIQHELARVVGERAKRGLAATSEVDRVAGDVAQAEAQVTDLDAALIASRRALLAVIGMGSDSLSTLTVEPSLGTVPAIPAAIPGDLLERRPDIQVAAARVRGAASNVRLAELDFFPKLTLNPGAGVSFQRGVIDTSTGFWSLGLGLAVPILDRPRLQALLDAEGTRAEHVVLAYERTVQTAFSEADQYLVRLQADRRRVDILEAGEHRSRTAYNAAHKRYELGFAGLQELLDSERAWRATRASLTAAKIEALQRSVQVFQALGGGWNAAKVTTAQDLKGTQ